jgi:hypothetical protein
MTHTYTINNTTANTGTITFGGAGGLTNQPLGNITISSGGAGSASTFGGAGQIYTTTGTGISSWATPSQTQFNGGNGKTVMSMPHGKDEVVLEKDATLIVKGKVVINDVDLEERLNTIEKVLQIPERDVKLEKKHPKLKKLYDEYIAALGKYRTFEAIKGEE